jgi:hypothetical protein
MCSLESATSKDPSTEKLWRKKPRTGRNTSCNRVKDEDQDQEGGTKVCDYLLCILVLCLISKDNPDLVTIRGVDSLTSETSPLYQSSTPHARSPNQLATKIWLNIFTLVSILRLGQVITYTSRSCSYPLDYLAAPLSYSPPLRAAGSSDFE